MKKFIVRILIFFAVVAMIDVAFGFACRYLNNHSKGGDTKHHYYIANECEHEILIFGSSRTTHHYVPAIIEDTLSMSCYNCGTEGNGIVLMYSRLKMITERYTPKIIIYDICDEFDVKCGDNMKYLYWQKRFYDREGVASVFDVVSKKERYKMYSMLYRYNESFVQMLMDNIHPQRDFDYGGYKPVYHVMGYEPRISEPTPIDSWDTVKYMCFINFIELCKEKNIKLIFAYSPAYSGYKASSYSLIKTLCADYNIPLIDFYTNREICRNKEYFDDTIHMNDNGAHYFTSLFVSALKSFLDIE